MNIVFTCGCGKSIAVKAEMAGRKGKCPACGAQVVVPKPPSPGEPDLLLDMPPPKKPSADAVPAGCPTCGAQFEPGAVICVHCGTNLMSGARIRTEASHDPIARKTSEREEIEADETRPFWRLTLGTVGKPGVTFASMPIQLSNPVMIAKMLVFYLLSVVIYALLASRGFAATPKDLPLGVIVIVMFAPVEFFINALLVNLGDVDGKQGELPPLPRGDVVRDRGGELRQRPAGAHHAAHRRKDDVGDHVRFRDLARLPVLQGAHQYIRCRFHGGPRDSRHRLDDTVVPHNVAVRFDSNVAQQQVSGLMYVRVECSRR
jgi:hypothetical protein